MLVNHEMTYVYFGIAKVQCQKLNIIGYLFPLSYILMHDLLKKKKCKENKKQKDKMLYILLQTCILGDVRVIEYTSKVIVLIKQL